MLILPLSVALFAGIAGGQKGRTSERSRLAVFSELPRLPLDGARPLTLPAFTPEAPGSSILQGIQASGEQARLQRFDWPGAWRVRELARVSGASPGELSVLPWAGDQPAWSLALSRPAERMGFYSSGWQLLLGGPPGARALLSVDLDRDGSPETLLISGRGAGGILHYTAPPAFEPAEAAPPEWLRDAAGASELWAWDLNEDHYEDLGVCRGRRPPRLLVNQGHLDFSVEDGFLPLEACSSLRLGPERRGIQWALAWHVAPVLLHRSTDTPRFERLEPGLPEDLRVLDGRIADVDADGREELLLLARKGTEAPASLLLFRLPESPRGELESLGPAYSCPGAERLALGDLDGDGAVDLMIAPRRELPILLRNTKAARFAERSFRLSLEDLDERFHAIGARVELVGDTDRLMRVRWPPLQGADQLMLWLTWNDAGGRLPRVQVTWTDGNAETFELQKGSYRHLRRDS